MMKQNCLTDSLLAQLGECRYVERVFSGLLKIPGYTDTQGLKRKLRLFNDMCKRLPFLVFSDKDRKP